MRVREPLRACARAIAARSARRAPSAGAVEPGEELGEVGDDQPAGGGRRRRAHVGGEVAERRVLLVPDRGHDRYGARGDRADEPLVGEGEQVLEAAAAAGEDDTSTSGSRARRAPSTIAGAAALALDERLGDERRCAGGKRVVIAVSTSRLAAASLPVTRPIRRGRRGSGRLRAVGEQPLGGELRLQPLERGEVGAEPEALDRERPQAEVAPLLPELGPPVDVHALAVPEVEPEPVELPARHRTREAGAALRDP